MSQYSLASSEKMVHRKDELQIFKKIKRIKFLSILLLSGMQFFIGAYSFSLVIWQIKNHQSYLVIVLFIFYGFHLISSGYSLIKLEKAGRLLSLTNMLVIGMFSLNAIIKLHFVISIKLVVWIFILSLCAYFFFFLRSKETKEIFDTNI